MKTPSHAVLNVALLLPHTPLASVIVLGSVLPDLPIFILYGWAKGVLRQDDATLWGETYYSPFWYTWTALVHSIPLALLGALGAALCHSSAGVVLGLSMVLHDLLDLPVHHDDAHCHFLPFSRYRFISPLSYWDPRHHGPWVALGESCLVLGASVMLWPSVTAPWLRLLLLLLNGLYLGFPAYRLLGRFRHQT